MISFIIATVKIIFLLGFLIFIHELGHFLVAKFCKVKVNEFAIGFGPTIWKKQGKQTKYELRLIPLGGFVRMEGEEERSEEKGSFSKASIPKRIAIVSAGAIVNILFAIIVYFIVIASSNLYISNELNTLVENNPTEDNFINRCINAGILTKDFMFSIVDNLKQLFTGKVGVEQMMGPVGISEVVSKTNGIREFIYMLSLISMSLGVTNLLPIPALDGGKILLLIIEAVRRKPLREQTEINIQLLGFSVLIALSLYVTYNDIIRIF